MTCMTNNKLNARKHLTNIQRDKTLQGKILEILLITLRKFMSN